jgi:hypothetical protein
VDFFEITCPNCNSTCGYDLLENNPEILLSHDWDSDIDFRDFYGETGEANRALWRQYKSLLLDDESTIKFFEKEFPIIGNYLEFLGENGIDGTIKDSINIENFINQYNRYNQLVKSREQLCRRAINRFYRIMKDSKESSL